MPDARIYQSDMTERELDALPVLEESPYKRTWQDAGVAAREALGGMRSADGRLAGKWEMRRLESVQDLIASMPKGVQD